MSTNLHYKILSEGKKQTKTNINKNTMKISQLTTNNNINQHISYEPIKNKDYRYMKWKGLLLYYHTLYNILSIITYICIHIN